MVARFAEPVLRGIARVRKTNVFSVLQTPLEEIGGDCEQELRNGPDYLKLKTICEVNATFVLKN